MSWGENIKGGRKITRAGKLFWGEKIVVLKTFRRTKI